MDNIKDYALYDVWPNTVSPLGHLFVKNFYFKETKNQYKNRMVRVYLPSTYEFDNPNKRFPVLYMMDGKNLFDDYTSFVGEWKIDEIIEGFINKKISDGIIVVGIDAPKGGLERHDEMALPNLKSKDQGRFDGYGYADTFADFIFNTIKKDIDQTFYTKKEKQFTGVGGSSMGGLMAYYLATQYKDDIGYALCFSPAFFLYNYEELKEKFLLPNIKNLPRIYLYVGGQQFEEEFVESTFNTYQLLREEGYTTHNVVFVMDSEMMHNEKAWSKYFPDALKWALDINRLN